MGQLASPDTVLTTERADHLAGPIQAWLAAKAGRSGSVKTKAAYTTTFASFRAALQAVALDLDGDTHQVALVAQAWAAAGEPAPATHNQRLAIASSFYTFVEKRGLLATSNPIRLVERRTVQAYAGATPLSAEVIQQQLQAIDRTTLVGQRDYALLVVYLATGRRLAEVASLQWGDVTEERGRLTLVFRHAKGGKVMRDQLPPATSAAVLAWLRALYGPALATLTSPSPLWVSLSRNGTYGQALSTRAIAFICTERLGTSKVHALRHSFAHAMETAGAKVSDIQARLGHANLGTTGRYLAALRADENPHGEALEVMFGVQACGMTCVESTEGAG